MTRPQLAPIVLFAVLALLITPGSADAFCGFYVGGAGAKLYNNATMVVMMRDGQRTVLSMQNNYQGPPQNFAMVIPVPVVLQKDNVKTLDSDLFDKIDRLAAPRLVEYWEKDPCWRPRPVKEKGVVYESAPAPNDGAGGVQIEAQFEVAEYEVVVLSAQESNGLDTWLRDNQYNIPEGAAPVLKPYVEGGMYFFVARVDVEKVKFNAQGQAMLSPLRFHYDSQDFSLPVRLGLLNAQGDQDLLVHVLARGQRYEAANYKNVTIPTNLEVADPVRERFGEFYAALFDETLAQNPGSVVTEYSWAANTCDPCPGPSLNQSDLLVLGADTLPEEAQRPWEYVLTRLHARYNRKSLGEDLVFQAAAPITGGREVRNANGALEHGSQPGNVNNFQGRYIIRHPWEGSMLCVNPIRGRWGGPPGGGGKRVDPAEDTAFAPRGELELAPVVRTDIPELKISAGLPSLDVPQGSRCGTCAAVAPAAGPRRVGGLWAALVLVVGVALARRT